MSQAKLILSQTPPFTIPLRYFLTAPLFGIGASLLLLAQPDTLFQSRWTPGLLAATHLLVLGYLAMVMLGALLQIESVLTGGQPPRVTLFGKLIHAGLTLGTLLLAFGLMLGLAPATHLAVLLLGLSFALFFTTLIAGLSRSSTRRDAARGITLAAACLAVTVGLGLWLALGHGVEGITLARQLTDIHLGWGLIGWSGILLVTIAYEVVPMFQLTPNYPPLLTRLLGGMLLGSLLLWTTGGLSELPLLSTVGGILCAGGLAGFAAVTLWLQTQRKKKGPDATVWFWRLAMINLLGAILLWLAAAVMPDLGNATSYPLLLGTLMIYGLLVSAVNGMLYKILPFLSWLHLSISVTEHKLSRRLIPNIKKTIPDEKARLQFWVHLSALLLIIGSCLEPKWITIPAAIAVAVSNGFLWWNLIAAVKMHKHTAATIKAAAITAGVTEEN